MNVVLYTAAIRIALLAIALLASVGALVAWRRRAAFLGTLAGVCALFAAGALVAELLVALAVRLDAPPSVRFNESRWVLLAPWRRTGLVLGGSAVVAIVALAWRAARRMLGWRRPFVIGLRAGAALAAFIMFIQPAIELRRVAREPNHIAVLVDDSASMTLRDADSGPTRFARALAVLKNSSTALAAWQQQHVIDFYAFSDTLRPLDLAALSSLPSDGASTQLRQALEGVRKRYNGPELAGVVVLSDGAAPTQFDGASDLAATRDFLRSLDARVHTLFMVTPGLRDVAIARVDADEFAFVRTAVKIDVVVRATPQLVERYPATIPVTLLLDGEAIRVKQVELPEKGGDVHVVFEVTPTLVGRYVYQVQVPQLPGEAVLTNNTATFLIRVIRDKVRVLQVSGQPSWDEKALRQMLRTNPNVDLISFFILRTQDDISMVPNDEMSLIPFPTRELFEQQLPSFDVIVLQNFEYMPYGIGEYLENLRAYVETGGGLVMLGGEQSFASGGYAGTPVAEALPVELAEPLDLASVVDTALFTPALTTAGASHPITALRFAASDNAATWRALPQLEGINLVERAKPQASVLAVHPTRKTRDGQPQPVIVVGGYGKGRSLAVTTDTLWRWGFVAAQQNGDDGRHYTKFWENAVRWLTGDPDSRNLQVETDAAQYDQGASVKVTVRLRGRDYQPVASGEVAVQLHAGVAAATAKEVATTRVVLDDEGQGVWPLATLPPGVYRLTARTKLDEREVIANEIFVVREVNREFEQPLGDAATLDTIALETMGTALANRTALPADLPFAAPRVVRVDQRTDVELWSRPGLLLVLLLLLGAEWLVRQRAGYV